MVETELKHCFLQLFELLLLTLALLQSALPHCLTQMLLLAQSAGSDVDLLLQCQLSLH